MCLLLKEGQMGQEVSGVCTQGQIPFFTACPEGWLAKRVKIRHSSTISQVPGDTVPDTEPKSLQDVSQEGHFPSAPLVPAWNSQWERILSDSSQKQR